ncbi:TPA: hypothetical protein R4Y05_001203 [Serratia liquefaciens]|uniref:hypothetical protein n=1 Tax=Serratia liquefaciens TaxID=614 RepID=UPI002183EA13|nr:hypothetical protein [Serratia liquefaciens]CAI2443602.1 Uncharacterised protein [Serratia liquefaciens]HED2335557.1 hypothetical protein [Serratia liquefaciens]
MSQAGTGSLPIDLAQHRAYARVSLWMRQQAQGVALVALNLKPLRRTTAEVLAEYALSEFPIGVVDAAMQDVGEAQP